MIFSLLNNFGQGPDEKNPLYLDWSNLDEMSLRDAKKLVENTVSNLWNIYSLIKCKDFIVFFFTF